MKIQSRHLKEWIKFLPIRIGYIAAGVFVVAVALPFAKDGELPKWAYLWDNDEDGHDGPPWYQKQYKWLPGPLRRYWWLAVRNPANNMRYDERYNLKLNRDNDLGTGDQYVQYAGEFYKGFGPSVARAKGGSISAYAWKGNKAGYWYIKPLTKNRHFRFRIGWKVMPYDKIKITDDKWRSSKGGYVGFTIQFLPFRKG